MTHTLPMDYPLSKDDQDKALALAKKLLVLAKGHSPAVIWPIAKRVGFPRQVEKDIWAVSYWGPAEATPEKAVAMAVIGGAQ